VHPQTPDPGAGRHDFYDQPWYCCITNPLYPPRWLERWPDRDRASRLVFIVHDLEPDEILRRFADGEPASLDSPAGVT